MTLSEDISVKSSKIRGSTSRLVSSAIDSRSSIGSRETRTKTSSSPGSSLVCLSRVGLARLVPLSGPSAPKGRRHRLSLRVGCRAAMTGHANIEVDPPARN